MDQPKILIIEDEENLANTIALNLRLENYNTDVAVNGPEALQKFSEGARTDLVLLDVMLPGISGFDLLGEFRKADPEVPIIFLTAKNRTAEKIAGLKLGADDYIVKPFELEELLLRIRNVLKRETKTRLTVIRFGNSKINFDTFEIIGVKGKKITLSKREIGVLKLLAGNINKVVSRDEIIETLWLPHENASSRTIDNYIMNFRKYFEDNPKKPEFFHSIRGVGYKFTPEPANKTQSE